MVTGARLTSASSRQQQQLLRQPVFLALLLVFATLAVYYPVRHFPFINYDDDLYVTENVHVQSGLEWDTIQWAFTTYTASNWHPLTWLSHALDFQFFGLDASGPHIVNLLIHTLNVVLLYWVLWRATGYANRSAMVAALFALHPINVQSVAWVAERKNLLSMLFFLLALGAYRWYASSPHISRYVVVGLLFALGLMAKPQIITLPLVLLLWDYWPLQRMSATTASSEPARTCAWLFMEKIPLLALSAASAMITLLAHRAGSAVRWYPLSLRVANAIASYARYVGMAIWPSRLAVFYPHPLTSLGMRQVLVSLAFLVLATVIVLTEINRRYLLVGWFWFLITLLPMIGIVQVGTQAMADRYAYLPFIELFLIAVWSVADWAERRHISSMLRVGVALAVLIALGAVTHRQLEYWRDSVTLWAHTLEVTRENYIAEIDLGAALVQRGDIAQAMEHFRAATVIDPMDPIGNMYLARYAQTQNNFSEAIDAYKKVVIATQDPKLKAQALSNMGYSYRFLGNEAEAQKCFRAAASLGE
jgi:tetratricopeptide (TPR) repeat protein